MADTTVPAVTQEVTPPTLLMADGQPTATSLQVAEHFGKRHTHVLRAIRNLAAELPDEHKPIFGLMSQSVEVGQGGWHGWPSKPGGAAGAGLRWRYRFLIPQIWRI